MSSSVSSVVVAKSIASSRTIVRVVASSSVAVIVVVVSVPWLRAVGRAIQSCIRSVATHGIFFSLSPCAIALCLRIFGKAAVFLFGVVDVRGRVAGL